VRLPESRRGKRLGIVAAIAVVVGIYYVISQVLPHENLQKVLNDLSNSLGAWTYLIVGVFAFLETGAFVGLIVPGETVMLLGGAVAGQGAIDVYLLIAIAWFCAWAGDTTSFFVGRRLGREFVLEHGPRVGISEERFEKVEAYFGRHGGKTILVGRFVSLVRALAPFIAGSSGMRYRAFVPYSILGCGLWASAHILIGYFFSRSINTAAKYAGQGAFLLATLIVMVVVVVLSVRFLRVAENRRELVERMEGSAATRWLVELGRRMQPQARFIWARLTPGGTFGLEFTTLLAILAIGLFVLIAYTEIVTTDPGPTPGDVTAQNVVDSIRTAWLTDFAKVFTNLGSGAVTWPLAFGCAVALAVGRRWLEFWVLLSGMLMTIIGVHELKAAVDRPRPDGALVSAAGSAFPSAHAAYSTLYVWLTVTIVIRLRPGMARGSLVVAGGIVLAGLIGLSRVYLGVHFLSDVNAGWAFGASAFGLCAAVALVISQFRQNPPAVLKLRTKTEA
jgi:membrane protein DedA with SNARE-associated domain